MQVSLVGFCIIKDTVMWELAVVRGLPRLHQVTPVLDCFSFSSSDDSLWPTSALSSSALRFVPPSSPCSGHSLLTPPCDSNLSAAFGWNSSASTRSWLLTWLGGSAGCVVMSSSSELLLWLFSFSYVIVLYFYQSYYFFCFALYVGSLYTFLLTAVITVRCTLVTWSQTKHDTHQ